jgi:hypothetical protein
MNSFLPTDDEISTSAVDVQVALDDVSSVEKAIATPERTDIVAYIEERFRRAEDARRNDEDRWLRSYRNFRGVYGPDVQFTDTEKSRTFIKITKTKVMAAYGQLIDVLFSGGKFPISIEPTELPEGVVEHVYVDPREPKSQPEETPAPIDPYGFAGDGREIPAGATLAQLLGPLQEKLNGLDVKEGIGQTPSAITFSPALVAAKAMEKKIHDQLTESQASVHLRSFALEMALFGAGVMKGPFVHQREYPQWDAKGNYTPVQKQRPQVAQVRIWDAYPDPEATSMSDAEYFIERHKLSKSQLRELKRRPFFRRKAIEALIETGYNYNKKWWEDDLTETETVNFLERFEVLEYWGYVDTETAEEAGLEIPSEFKDMDQVQINAWVSGNHILRLVFNPFKPQRIPYLVCPYEHNPYSFFGIGVAENMEDTQTLMNGFMRLAVDNAVLSGNVVFEIDETNLVPGQDFKLYPGKMFRRQGGQPGTSINSIKIPNITNELMLIFDKARNLADEATLPSVTHGSQNAGGATSLRTSSGMSMLMGAAGVTIKTVVKNIDDYLLRPLGEAFFAFNMQFDFDENIVGDLAIKARGAESLMQNEVRSQRLMTLMQVGTNPALAPLIKWPYVLSEIAKSLDLDAEKVSNNPDEAMRQALLMQAMGMNPQGAPQDAPAGANPLDPTGAGGGNQGTGSVPQMGEPGFTGNDLGGGNGQGPSSAAPAAR